jgi:hypothetical protein
MFTGIVPPNMVPDCARGTCHAFDAMLGLSANLGNSLTAVAAAPGPGRILFDHKGKSASMNFRRGRTRDLRPDPNLATRESRQDMMETERVG